MKKVLLLLILILGITACSNGNISKIAYDELNEKIENKETFILLFNDKSTDGELLKQTLETVLIEQDLKAYEIDPTKLKENEKEALRPIISYQDVSIIFIKDGVDPSILSHITSSLTREEEITNRLIDMEFIKATK